MRAPDRLTGPSVLAIIADMSGPSLWRVLQPITMLEKRGYPAGWDYKHARGIGEVAAGCDGVIIPRMAWHGGDRALAETWFAMLRRAGKFVVYDADDDVFGVELSQRARRLGWAGSATAEQLEAQRQARTWAMQQCDGVTVSTQRLATVVRGLTTRPVVVVPNAIDVAWFRRVLRGAQRRIDGVTIGWAGGTRPDDDLFAVAEAWRRVAARCPEVRFVVAGYLAPVLAAAVPAERLIAVPWMALERYPATLRDVDIACCAVADTPFNRSKSQIKAYEAAVAGAAVVASPTVYGSLIEHGVTGYVAETADEWEHGLVELVERPALRSMLARRLLKHVERHCSLSENLWRWPSAWQQIQEASRGRIIKLA